MRRRTSLAAAAALGAAWALTACGIPTDKAPEVVSDAPTDFDSSAGANPTVYKPTTVAEETVENFLKAASGDPDSRNDQLNSFTVSGDSQFSEPSEGIRLVAGIDVTVSDTSDIHAVMVQVTGSVVGNYLEDGSVRMNSSPGEYDETFTLQREDVSDVWKMNTLPVQVALDYDHFTSAYEQAPMYFQAGPADLLVPDLRWIYRELDAETRQRLLFAWLFQRPGDFASVSARNAIPTDTVGKISPDGAEVDLSPSETIDDETAEAIAAQIVWTLGLSGEFTLTTDGDVRVEGDAAKWRNWNAIPQDLPETAYFIADGTVWEYSADRRVTQHSNEHPWVGYQAEGLRQVAVGPTGSVAAIVAGSGGDVLQTGANTSTVREVAGLTGSLADPQWLEEGTLLVIDDGVPTLVTPSTGATQPLGVGEDVTAMALAADGRRLAYVEGGFAWVAPLGLDADQNLTVGTPRRIGPDIENVADVAWSSENYLWVAGEREDEQLFRVAIDNSRTVPQEGTGTFLPITQIAANPAEPTRENSDRGEPVIIVANSTLWRVYTSGPDEIRNGDQPVGGTAPFTVLSIL
ncbi:LpqB family beta-propeller domain-containing protein [Glycomyces tritici]|uniref:GerMN domain-containing protein n=1 Tax=Glycomyces tritici TaxID=2665176 RepID=A0ABT7YP06_9ACTN|nr:LpqB family beta-propeller domain-containing protein [Glycomyces tritici]MDN3240331.1 GerMN domain-containing protein [Glycomyces tritici]